MPLEPSDSAMAYVSVRCLNTLLLRTYCSVQLSRIEHGPRPGPRRLLGQISDVVRQVQLSEQPFHRFRRPSVLQNKAERWVSDFIWSYPQRRVIPQNCVFVHLNPSLSKLKNVRNVVENSRKA